MKNQDLWRPTKALKGKSSDVFRLNPIGVYGGSYHIATLQIECYQKIIRKYSAGNLLDAGCGKVPFYEMYADLVSQVTCMDWDASNVHLDIVTNINQPWPLPDSTFDTIIISDVISHVDPEIVFREASRVLKIGGKLLVFSPFLYWICDQPYDFQRLTEFAYKKLTKENAFEVVELEPYGGRIDVILDLLNKKFSRGIPYRIVVWLSKTIRRTSFYKRSVNRTKRIFPAGYYLVAEKKQ